MKNNLWFQTWAVQKKTSASFPVVHLVSGMKPKLYEGVW